jgi:hypothetical protein
VDDTLPLADYNKTKEKLLLQKRAWAEKLTHVETTRQTSIEPTIRFFRGLTEARFVAQGDDAEQQRDLMQKTCSNLQLQGGRVLWEARGAWKHVVPLARFARRPSNALTKTDASQQPFSVRWSAPPKDRMAPGEVQTFFNGNPAWA